MYRRSNLCSLFHLERIWIPLHWIPLHWNLHWRISYLYFCFESPPELRRYRARKMKHRVIFIALTSQVIEKCVTYVRLSYPQFDASIHQIDKSTSFHLRSVIKVFPYG